MNNTPCKKIYSMICKDAAELYDNNRKLYNFLEETCLDHTKEMIKTYLMRFIE